jgi:hypothetical protein
MEHRRSDIASFTINFSLPPEVIREYFNGLEKVEKARKTENKSQEYLMSLGKMLGQYFFSQMDSEKEMSRKRPRKIRKTTFSIEIPNTNNVESETKNEQKTETENVPSPCSCCPEDGENLSDESIINLMTEKREEKKKQETKTETKIETPATKTPNIFEFSNFVSEGNQGGLADMMKAFMPVVESLVGGMKQQRDEPSTAAIPPASSIAETSEPTKNCFNETMFSE